MDPITLEIMKPVLNPLFPDFEKIYQIEFPLYIETMEFDDSKSQVDIRVSFHRKALFRCACGRDGLKVHSRLDRVWRGLDIARYQCRIHLAVPRLKCPECGVKTFQVPWARDHAHLTALLEEKIMDLADYMPHSAVARILGESDHRVLHVLEARSHPAAARHASRGRPRTGLSLSKPPRVGAGGRPVAVSGHDPDGTGSGSPGPEPDGTGSGSPGHGADGTVSATTGLNPGVGDVPGPNASPLDTYRTEGVLAMDLSAEARGAGPVEVGPPSLEAPASDEIPPEPDESGVLGAPGVSGATDAPEAPGIPGATGVPEAPDGE
ncbi:MAG: hypothetical protein LBR80_07310 [Deltaproteobacteria bacterium]|jgi:hypothetical protein|nr:hypothetical protein [Deltaproteobacteria bacterium]